MFKQDITTCVCINFKFSTLKLWEENEQGDFPAIAALNIAMRQNHHINSIPVNHCESKLRQIFQKEDNFDTRFGALRTVKCRYLLISSAKPSHINKKVKFQEI